MKNANRSRNQRIVFWIIGLVFLSGAAAFIDFFTPAGAADTCRPRACLTTTKTEVKQGDQVEFINCSTFSGCAQDPAGHCEFTIDGARYSDYCSSEYPVQMWRTGTREAKLCVAEALGAGWDPSTMDCKAIKVSVKASDQVAPGNFWPTTESALFGSESDLALFRQYRDEALRKTQKGKLYVDLLYENSEQALRVFEQNPDLVRKAKALIEANVEGVSRALNGQRGEIARTKEIASFLEEFGKKSPATLKVLCSMMKQEMLRKHKQGKPFLGFKMN